MRCNSLPSAQLTRDTPVFLEHAYEPLRQKIQQERQGYCVHQPSNTRIISQNIIYKRGQLKRYRSFKYNKRYGLIPLNAPPETYSNAPINADPYYFGKKAQTLKRHSKSKDNSIQTEGPTMPKKIKDEVPKFKRTHSAQPRKQLVHQSFEQLMTDFDHSQPLFSKLRQVSLQKKSRQLSQIFRNNVEQFHTNINTSLQDSPLNRTIEQKVKLQKNDKKYNLNQTLKYSPKKKEMDQQQLSVQQLRILYKKFIL